MREGARPAETRFSSFCPTRGVKAREDASELGARPSRSDAPDAPDRRQPERAERRGYNGG